MPTANDSIDLKSVLKKIEHLKTGIATVIHREEGLIRSRAERGVMVRKEMMAREEDAAEKSERRTSEIGAARRRGIEAAAAWKERREAWIQHAYHAAKAALAGRAQGAKDQRIGTVQGEIMKARRERQLELERAGEEHQAFLELLASDRDERRALRDAFLAVLRTHRVWIRPMFKGRWKGGDAAGRTAAEERAILTARLDEVRAALRQARGLPLARIFRWLPFWGFALAVVGIYFWLGWREGGPGLPAVLPMMRLSLAILAGVWLLSFLMAVPAIRRAAAALAEAKRAERAAARESTLALERLEKELRGDQDEEGKNLSETFRESDSEWRNLLDAGHRKLDRQLDRLPRRLESLAARKLARAEAVHDRALVRATEEAAERRKEIDELRAKANAKLDVEMNAALDSLMAPWKNEVLPAFAALQALERRSLEQFPAWDSETCHAWQAPALTPRAVRVGCIRVDVARLAGGLPHDARFALPDLALDAPLALGLPEPASLMLEGEGDPVAAAGPTLAAVVLRLVASFPPGRASFVFIDPVGLGRDFAGLMHLADYEESLIHHRIWTQAGHIEERLAELNEHIEKVIQMYLRDEYPTLADYNEQAGSIAEKYRFLVIAGFPHGFSDTALKRLRSIAASGGRCGVHLLIQRDAREPLSDPAVEGELRRACLRVRCDDAGFHLHGVPPGADAIGFDPPPAAGEAKDLVHRIGKASLDSNRIQVPFSQIAPPPGEEWSLATVDELRVPIGRTGARKQQMLAIGKGTRQHMLVAGKTGSGKSTLFHVIITNLALWCSPREVEFHLIDFKKGVEFKCYATRRLPHARVIAIESDREFALSVLRRLDQELVRRGELFREAGAQDLAAYRNGAGHPVMPRSLLMIDEFQEFFTEDDAIAQEASLLLDRIVRQGRAFGIHVILGSQTLGGAYTLARATLGQMVIRVALQCNEADAQLIMDDDNPAPRMLSRPGEGIYNDQAGALAANSPFQIVWLPEDERDAALDRIQRLARDRDEAPFPAPVVFEGNAPADISENPELERLRRSVPQAKPAVARVWLGAPNSIKGPTEALFSRHTGSNLLVVGQSSTRSATLLSLAIASLAAQYPPDGIGFVVLDPYAGEDGDGGIFHLLAQSLGSRMRRGGPAECGEMLAEVVAAMETRAAGPVTDFPELFVVIHDLQRFKMLRPNDDFRFSLEEEGGGRDPSQAFASLAGEGGSMGIHLLVSADGWNNVSRWIPRKLLADFEMRVLFQMSANDSANLIDSPAAASLGLHRALLHHEQAGTQETFRPYAAPDRRWFGAPAVTPAARG